jgi:hypothetical protein
MRFLVCLIVFSFCGCLVSDPQPREDGCVDTYELEGYPMIRCPHPAHKFNAGRVEKCICGHQIVLDAGHE